MCRFWSKIQINSLFAAIAVYVVSRSVEGIISNGAYDIFLALGKTTLSILQANPWLIYVGIFCIILYFTSFAFWWAKFIQIRQKEIEGSLNGDEKWKKFIKIVMSKESSEEDVKTFTKSLLLDVIREMAVQPRRVTLFVPDKNEEYLIPWTYVGWLDEKTDNTKKRKQFYIGQEEKKRGIAGEAYYQKETLSVRLYKKKQLWEVDDHDLNKCFIPYEGQEKGITPLYRSIICWPVLAGSNCLGVVCVDSKNLYAFSPRNIDMRLLMKWLNIQIVSVLRAREEYEKCRKEAGELEIVLKQ